LNEFDQNRSSESQLSLQAKFVSLPSQESQQICQKENKCKENGITGQSCKHTKGLILIAFLHDINHRIPTP
jgi:hypothetical protein